MTESTKPPEPQAGGSYVRCPETHALTRVEPAPDDGAGAPTTTDAPAADDAAGGHQE